MKVKVGALASAALLGGSLFLGAGAAQAFSCPAGQHAITMGGASACVDNPSGGGTGGPITYDGGGQKQAPIGQIVMPPQAPPAPAWNPPANNIPPVYVPQQPAPIAARPEIPAAPQAPAYTGYRPAATGEAPAYTAPGGAAVTKNAQGVWVNPETGVAADAEVAAQAAAAEAAPAEAPAAAPAVVLPKTELQAVDALRSATATPAEKDAALVIVKAKIDSVLDKAIDKALGNR